VYDASLVLEVLRGDHDDRPAEPRQLLEPFPVALALPRVPLMPDAVVLDDHAMRRVDQVAPGDEPTELVEDLAIALGPGEPGEDQHQADERLHRRLDALADVREHGAGPAYPVEVDAVRV